MNDVRLASLADRELLAHIAATGFYDDPVLSWVLPDDDRRTDQLRFLFTSLVDDTLPDRGVVDLAGRACVAFWRDPTFEYGRPADQLDETLEDAPDEELLLFSADDLERLAILGDVMLENHPHESHWYLNVVSTLPGHQGNGLGSVALDPGLARCDADGCSAYLESTNPRNRTLYRRKGFVDAGEIQIPDGPAMLQMWRDPR